MITGRAYSDAFYRLYIIGQLYKFHSMSFAILFDDGFADRIHDFSPALLLDDTDFV